MAEAKLVDDSTTFDDLDLDARIIRALSKQGLSRPTLVQSRAIPFALEGKDILARARTGSGKTLSYILPIVQKILMIKKNSSEKNDNYPLALILVPTRELSEQVTIQIDKVLIYAQKHIKVTNLSGIDSKKRKPDGSIKEGFVDGSKVDIIVSTPAKIGTNLDLNFSKIKYLVIDEADLVLSYGYEQDLRNTLEKLPKLVQSFLMSATMTNDVETLKNLVLHNPIILRLEEEEDESEYITHYVLRTTPEDKFLLTYVIFKLKLVKGKTIIFVNSIDRCYRVKLFLEQFGIRTCVLNSELPVNSRFHIVQEFNKGIYDTIIATDEANTDTLAKEPSDDEEEETQTLNPIKEPEPEKEKEKEKERQDLKSENQLQSSSKKKKSFKKENKSEYGVTRGIDFVGVTCVLNFDFPSNKNSFIHRAGRTARAGRKGMTLSFVSNNPSSLKHDWDLKGIPIRNEEKILLKISKYQEKKGNSIKDYSFDMKQVEGFRYRIGDALRLTTRSVVKEARIKELKDEVLNSEKLKSHFEDNPLDLIYLRHDKPLQKSSRIQPHLKHVPSYLLPNVNGVTSSISTEIISGSGFGSIVRRNGKLKRNQNGKRRDRDPLRKFEYGGITKNHGNRRTEK